MPSEKQEKHLLKAATNAFTYQTGFTLALDKNAQGKQILRLETDEATAELEVVVLPGGVPGINAAFFFARMLINMQGRVVILDQITAEMAEECRKNSIQFMDTVGNGYINQPPIYVFIKGNKRKRITKAPAVNRVFKQTGLRVLYALLCNPGMENETYRTIAAKTDVALGMVNWVFKDLKELGFLLETGTGRNKNVRLLHKEKLLDRWITAYAEQLRPKLLLGRYRGAEGWWQNAQLNPEQALWGGEPAAAKLTNYLKPQEITVYLDKDNPAAVLIPNRLKKDPVGDVELVARFWQPKTVAPHGGIVHPVLVYADLMATGNQRNIETARMIYDEYIVQLVREN